MSPSWTKLARWMGGADGARIGLNITPAAVSAVCLRAVAQQWHADWIAHQPLTEMLFRGEPTAAIEETLVRALADLMQGRAAAPVHIGLPDPVVSVAVFELDAVPKDDAGRQELARWRFAKTLRVDADKLTCATQVLGRGGDKPLLLGLAMDRAWWACIERAACRAGCVVASTSAGGCFRFNRFHSRLTQARQGGALVHLDETAWSVSIWDEFGNIRAARSRWHEPDANTADLHGDVVQEIQRAVRAYAHGQGREVAHLFVTGPALLAQSLVAEIETQIHGECTLLHEEADVQFAEGVPGHTSGIGTAIAAAMPA